MANVMGHIYNEEQGGILLVKKSINTEQAVVNQKVLQDMLVKGEEIVGKMLNDEAQKKNYGDIISACSYAGAPNPFQEESMRFLAWRGAVWASLYLYVNKVMTGQVPMPETIEEVLSVLPKFTDF